MINTHTCNNTEKYVLPNLFIIGGQKCGSTTLFDDLAKHPDVFAPPVKEPTFFSGREETDESGPKDYNRILKKGKNSQYRLDGTTSYSMREKMPGIPEQISRLCGSDCKIIYIVRNPIERIKSHYVHGLQGNSFEGSFEDALERYPELIDNSRYFQHISPWIKLFGRENVLIVQFEAYVADRLKAVVFMQKWLGLSIHTETIDITSAKNSSGERRRIKGPIGKWTHTAIWKKTIQNWAPPSVYQFAKKYLSYSLPTDKVDIDIDLANELWKKMYVDIEGISALCDFPENNRDLLWYTDGDSNA